MKEMYCDSEKELKIIHPRKWSYRQCHLLVWWNFTHSDLINIVVCWKIWGGLYNKVFEDHSCRKMVV